MLDCTQGLFKTAEVQSRYRLDKVQLRHPIVLTMARG